jgi:hypothetical protein
VSPDEGRGQCVHPAGPCTTVPSQGTQLNGVEPQAWLTDVLERMVSGRTKTHELARLLPWNWQAGRIMAAAKA